MLESESESASSLVSCVSTICDGEPPVGCDVVAACVGPSCENAPAWDEPRACGIEAETACDDVAAIDEALPFGAGGCSLSCVSASLGQVSGFQL